MESTQRLINVKTVSGEVKSVTVGAHIPVSEFKHKVMEAFGVPIDRQRLICQGKLLKDEHLISDYVKEDGNTVHLMIRAADQPAAPVNAPPPPQSPPQGSMPFQLDQMLASMMGNIFQGGQILSATQVIIPQGPGNNRAQAPPVPNHQPLPQNPPGPPNSNPSVPSNPPGNAPNNPPGNAPNSLPGNAPRHPVDFALPFDHIHNIGQIVNEMHGPGSGFPPPRMPQIPLNRNPLVLLGGFLYNYQFQLMRLLPFISRVGDLIQRESLITDPNERLLLQDMAQRVGLALNQLVLATTPITPLLEQLQIGPSPGQFQLRIGNLPVASEVRQEPPPPAPVQAMPVPQNFPFPFPFPGMQGMQVAPPGANQAAPANMLVQFLPMLTQMLGGNQNMTLRELLSSLQMHDEEESLPMMEFFYNLSLTELFAFASGNWEAVERQRPTVRESLLRLMEQDSPEGRMRIVQILLEYMQRQYAVPEQFAAMVSADFSPPQAMASIGEHWLLRLVNHVMDYQGPGFIAEFKQILELMIGNYSEELSTHIQGGVPTVMQVLQIQLQQGMARIVPPEFSGMIGGAMGGIMSAYVTKSISTFAQWKAVNRTQEEAREAPKTPAAALLATWQETIQRDLAVEVPVQRAFSRSYLEADVFTQQIEEINVRGLFVRNIHSAFHAAGVSPVPDSAPQNVIEEFMHRLVEDIRGRISNDQDYRHGRFENLDRIRK